MLVSTKPELRLCKFLFLSTDTLRKGKLRQSDVLALALASSQEENMRDCFHATCTRPGRMARDNWQLRPHNLKTEGPPLQPPEMYLPCTWGPTSFTIHEAAQDTGATNRTSMHTKARFQLPSTDFISRPHVFIWLQGVLGATRSSLHRLLFQRMDPLVVVCGL